MSRIRVDLLGAANSEPRIEVSSKTTRKEVFGTTIEADLPGEDAVITVDFRIPKELRSKIKTPVQMPVFTQELVFGGGASDRPAVHRPSTSNSGARLNPRFIPVQDSGTALGTGSLLHYRVDCQFLGMNDMARALDPTLLRGLDPLQPDPLRPAGVEVRLYECTIGLPRFWAVAFAPGNVAPNAANLHTVVFLMPKTSPYTDLSDLSLFSVRRYLQSAPANMPFFIRCGNPADPLGDADWFTTVTNAGMLDQMLQSGAPILLALPIPSGGAVVPSGPNIRELMRSLRRCLHADELAKKAQEIPAKFRVCVSGFSRGADVAAELLSQQLSSVDEFYWFDPPVPSQKLGGKVAEWVNGSGDRRLRMVGTVANSFVHTLANSLNLPATRVSAMPEPGFRRSAIYKAAVSVPVHSTALTFPEQFHNADDANAPNPGSLSDATGIFSTRDNQDAVKPVVTLIARNLSNGKVNPPQTVQFTPEEVAGKARFGMLNNDRRTPPRSGTAFGERLEAGRGLKLADFVKRFLIGEILDPGEGSIHQWATVGGLGGGGASPRSGFKGFFQICLEGGDLPK